MGLSSLRHCINLAFQMPHTLQLEVIIEFLLWEQAGCLEMIHFFPLLRVINSDYIWSIFYGLRFCGYVRIITLTKKCLWPGRCVEWFENGIHLNPKNENPIGKDKGFQIHYWYNNSWFDLSWLLNAWSNHCSILTINFLLSSDGEANLILTHCLIYEATFVIFIWS